MTRRRARTRAPDRVRGTLQDGADAAQGLVGAEYGRHRLQAGAVRRAGEKDPDDLGCLPDRARVGGAILAVDLLAGREPEVRRELADLAEPVGAFGWRLVPAGKGRGDGTDQVWVQAAEPGVSGISDQLEQ